MTIRFNEFQHTLLEYDKEFWEINEERNVEFFPNKIFKVHLISSEDTETVERCLSELDDGNPIAIDLEWEIEINLFQFCSSKGVLLIRHPEGNGKIEIFNFIATHKFYGKGIGNDVKQLQHKFGHLVKNKSNCNSSLTQPTIGFFKQQIEDISKTRLASYGFSENFNEMTEQFAGKSCAEFKDVQMTFSNWMADKLTIRQVLYAAFDVVALFECYPNFRPPKLVQCSKNNISNAQHKLKNNDIRTPTKNTKNINRKLKRINNIENPKKKKTGISKIIVLRKPVQKTWPFVIYGYNGPKSPVDLLLILENDACYASAFSLDDKETIVFACFSKEISEEEVKKRLVGYADSVEKVSTEGIDPLECTDREFLYVSNIPIIFHELNKFIKLLDCFGTNFTYIKGIKSCQETEDNVSTHFNYQTLNKQYKSEINTNKKMSSYYAFEPRSAISSYRMKIFISNFLGMNVLTFPWFLTKIRVDEIPPHVTESQLLDFVFPNALNIKYILAPNKESKHTAFVTFHTIKDAEKAIAEKNYLDLNKIIPNDSIGKIEKCSNSDISFAEEIRIARYVKEPHLRYLKLFELVVHEIPENSNSIAIREKFEKFGRIYSAYYDSRFNVGHVQFYKRKDAFKALNELNKLESGRYCEFIPEEQILVIRDLVFEVNDDEIFAICKPFGNILNITTRDTKPFMDFIIKEIAYDNKESACKARSRLLAIKIKRNAVRAAILNGGNIESPQWKNKQRRKWVIFRNNISAKIYYECLKYGTVLRYEVHNNKDTYVMFSKIDAADTLIKYYNITSRVTNYYSNRKIIFQNTNDSNDNDKQILESPTIKEFVNILNPEELGFIIDEKPSPIIASEKNSDEKISSEEEESSSSSSPIVILIENAKMKFSAIQIKERFIKYKDLFDLITDKCNGKKRVIIYASSKSLTNKLFSKIRTKYYISGSAPVRIKLSDIENPPMIDLSFFQNSNLLNGSTMRKKATKLIMVDPLPFDMNEEVIRSICRDCGDFDVEISDSSIYYSRKRAILSGINHSNRNKLMRSMNGSYKGTMVTAVMISSDSVPLPIMNNC